MKTRIRQFKAANRPASKRNIILVACNLILVTGAVCAAIIYSQIIMEQKNELRKDAFCTTVESMKQVSENYLYTEKGYVDEWAAYISSQHMTAEQALDFINATNTHADRQAHLVNLDDLSAHSSGMTGDNIWVHCYEDMANIKGLPSVIEGSTNERYSGIEDVKNMQAEFIRNGTVSESMCDVIMDICNRFGAGEFQNAQEAMEAFKEQEYKEQEKR